MSSDIEQEIPGVPPIAWGIWLHGFVGIGDEKATLKKEFDRRNTLYPDEHRHLVALYTAKQFKAFLALQPKPQDVEARYADLLNRLGVNGHDGAIAEISKLRVSCGLET